MSSATTAAPKVCQSCGARYTTDALFCPNDGTPLTSTAQNDSSGEIDPYLGREISGHIEIRQLAGIGAMGRVYRAFQKGIDRDVAVKVLHRELSANQQLVARFHREAKVASRLQHPNVVQVHLAGQLPDGALYIVMEYLDGMSLQSALAAAGGSMPLPRALHIGLQICDAVGEAHAQGIVHRDLKPENVMLVRRGDDVDYVKVLDFGIARLNWGEQSMATAAGLIFGTARYISPEGAQGEAVGPAGDVYAIATLLYQLLAGRTPFEGDQAVALLVQQIHDKPPLVKSIPRASYLPDVLSELIMRNLAKAPMDRAADGRVLGRLLVDAAKAAGLSVDDLMARSALLGARPSALQLAAVQGTKKLPLGPELQQKLSAETRVGDARDAGAPWAPSPNPRASDADLSPRTLAVAPPTRASEKAIAPAPSTMLSPQASPVAVAADPPPAASTTKWVVPAALAGKLSPPREPVTSSVDPTLDDDDGTPPPAVKLTPAPRAKTEYSPGPIDAAPYPAFPVGAGGPVGGGTLDSPARLARLSPAPPRLKLTAAVGMLPGDEDDLDEINPRRSRSRQAVVIFLCFMLGVALASGVLYRMGRIGPGSTTGTLDDYVARANSAMRQQRWDSPPHDNVRDLTNEALTKWPREPRIQDIRARATDELVKEAMGRKFAGDLSSAQHLAHLANELDPTDTTAQHLIEQLDQEAKAATIPDPGAQGTVDAGSTVHGPTHPPVPPLAPGPRGSLEVSAAKPRVGQGVTFVARVGGPKARVDDPHFRLDGPGLVADTKLTALPQSPGVYQTSFTFFEGGKYEVGFTARVDGAMMKITRVITVDGGENAIPGPLPVPDGGKWL